LICRRNSGLWRLFVYSFCVGSLPPRLPDLQRMTQIEEGPLDFGLIGAAAGTLVSLSLRADT
jgi:hypothetical protein